MNSTHCVIISTNKLMNTFITTYAIYKIPRNFHLTTEGLYPLVNISSTPGL
jgi:hypothetical protein